MHVPPHSARIERLLKERILVLDGAMGTRIQRENLTEEGYRGERFRDFPGELRGNNDLLTLTQPGLIRRIHCEYLEAGADIIETNTFNSTSVSMADYGMESLVYELNFDAARLAKSARKNDCVMRCSQLGGSGGAVHPARFAKRYRSIF